MRRANLVDKGTLIKKYDFFKLNKNYLEKNCFKGHYNVKHTLYYIELTHTTDEQVLHSLANLITHLKLHLNIYCIKSPSLIQHLIDDKHAVLLADWSIGSFIPEHIFEKFTAISMGALGDDDVYVALQDVSKVLGTNILKVANSINFLFFNNNNS